MILVKTRAYETWLPIFTMTMGEMWLGRAIPDPAVPCVVSLPLDVVTTELTG